MIFVMNITQIYVYKRLKIKRYKKGNTMEVLILQILKQKSIIREKMIT